MTKDELYIEYLTAKHRLINELGSPQDMEALHYQALLQLSYKVTGNRDLAGDELIMQILKLHDEIKNYKIH